MIYVTLVSNSSMDIYPDKKILSFNVKLPETLQIQSRALGSSIGDRNSVSSFMVQYEKSQELFYWLVQYCYRASIQ